MLQSFEQPVEFRFLHYEDRNSKSLTMKCTKQLSPKGMHPHMFITDTLDCLMYNILENERTWPPDLPDPKPLYTGFYNKIHDLLCNIVCASCGCIGHNQSDYTLISIHDQCKGVALTRDCFLYKACSAF